MSRQDVTLIPIGQGSTFKWKVVHNKNSGEDPAHYPKVALPVDSGPHLIIFQLSGNHSGITFAQDPIWVQAGSKPGQKADHPQIPFAVPLNNGKALAVLDLNSNDPATVLKLYYRLNFDGAPYLDPIIENGGGTVHPPAPPPPPASFLGTGSTAVLIAVAVGLLILGAAIGRLLWR